MITLKYGLQRHVRNHKRVDLQLETERVQRRFKGNKVVEQRYYREGRRMTEDITKQCTEALNSGKPYIREKDIRLLKMQYNRCNEDDGV